MILSISEKQEVDDIYEGCCLINDANGGMCKGGHGLNTVWAWFHDCMGTVSDYILNGWGDAGD